MIDAVELECSKKNIQNVINTLDSLTAKQQINIFLLSAEVGMGKTYLVKQYANNKGFMDISSPTFSFIHEYSNKDSKIFHYDLYLKNDMNAKEVLLETLCFKGVHFIEWGNETLALNLHNVGFKVALINISNGRDDITRFYKIKLFI